MRAPMLFLLLLGCSSRPIDQIGTWQRHDQTTAPNNVGEATLCTEHQRTLVFTDDFTYRVEAVDTLLVNEWCPSGPPEDTTETVVETGVWTLFESASKDEWLVHLSAQAHDVLEDTGEAPLLPEETWDVAQDSDKTGRFITTPYGILREVN